MKRILYLFVSAMLLVVVIVAVALHCANQEEGPNRWPGRQEVEGEIIFVSKKGENYLIYVNNYLDREPLEIWITEEVELYDDEGGARFKRILRNRQTGVWIEGLAYLRDPSIDENHPNLCQGISFSLVDKNPSK